MQLNELRSLLFVPANAPAFVARAHERGADAVIIDLEDAILPAQKEDARRLVQAATRFLAGHGLPVLLRVNADAWQLDLACADLSCLAAVVLPKVEHPDQVRALSAALIEYGARQVQVAALIESPLGVMRAFEIAQASPALCALGFGAEDYAAALAIAPEPVSLRWAAQQVSNSARALGLGCWGLADSIANLSDMERFAGAVLEARALGYTGSVAIHPKQVAYINRGFSPSVAELVWAQKVLEAAGAAGQEGRGVIVLDGRMVDLPLVERARRWLAGAQAR